jgi:hypothetical protein
MEAPRPGRWRRDVGNKRRRNQQPPEPGAASPDGRRTLTIGLIVAAACAIVAIGVASYVIGAPKDNSSSKAPAATTPAPRPTPDAADLALVPTPPGAEPSEASAAADALANKTWDQMSQDEHDLVRTELTRTWSNAGLRVESSNILARDIFVLDGKTRAAREYEAVKSDGSTTGIKQALTFFCDNSDGTVENFIATIDVDGRAALNRVTTPQDTYPFFAILSGLDWTDVKDLGWDTVAGHRAHGFDILYTNSTGGKSTRIQNWIDVTTAHLLRRYEESTGSDFHFDWRQPAPLTMPTGAPKAPCADVFYRKVPNAMPPGYQFGTPTAAAGAAPTQTPASAISPTP